MMKKTIFTLILALSLTGLQAQKFMSREVYIRFFGETPLERIDATTDQGSGVIDIDAGTLAFQVLMKSFKFEKALMQEHFNENYVESDKYPKAVFKGKLKDKIDANQKGVQKVTAVGTMEMHGKEKEMEIPLEAEMIDGKLRLSSVFMAKPEDFDIKIPSVVRDKIAEKMEVTVKAELNPR